jgi:hypothetical protein
MTKDETIARLSGGASFVAGMQPANLRDGHGAQVPGSVHPSNRASTPSFLDVPRCSSNASRAAAHSLRASSDIVWASL